MTADAKGLAGTIRAAGAKAAEHSLTQRFVNILLQNKRTLNFVDGLAGWTTKRQKARVFGTGLEALFFCFNHHIANMQILGEFGDARMNFTMPVTDLRGD